MIQAKAVILATGGSGRVFLTSTNAVINTGAVSYTHLRAHETVLDLVCRLLLETKKYNKKYHMHLLRTTGPKSCDNMKDKKHKQHQLRQT